MNEFYKRMMAAKKRKKEALEQAQLRAEFEAHPERFNSPQPIIVKTDAEVMLDQAFAELQQKLRRENPTPKDRLEQAFNDLERKAEGL